MEVCIIGSKIWFSLNSHKGHLKVGSFYWLIDWLIYTWKAGDRKEEREKFSVFRSMLQIPQLPELGQINARSQESSFGSPMSVAGMQALQPSAASSGSLIHCTTKGELGSSYTTLKIN